MSQNNKKEAIKAIVTKKNNLKRILDEVTIEGGATDGEVCILGTYNSEEITLNPEGGDLQDIPVAAEWALCFPYVDVLDFDWYEADEDYDLDVIKEDNVYAVLFEEEDGEGNTLFDRNVHTDYTC